MIVVLHQGRLAIEIPSRTLRELEKTTEDYLWSYVENPENLVRFHREGAAPATTMELRQKRTDTVPRFEPKKDLPSLDELFARRPDRRRTEKLGALGTLRMNGSIERTISPEKGSFELLSARDEHSRLKLRLGGAQIQQVVVAKRASTAIDLSGRDNRPRPGLRRGGGDTRSGMGRTRNAVRRLSRYRWRADSVRDHGAIFHAEGGHLDLSGAQDRNGLETR
jgi:hypothetical protein